ncbi:hypothetical protein HOD38_01120 [archaeon]|jgi:hypothetical protein|nr:hypothetical protein [archaeon]MBT4396845.1 hypothetical protein [archaeon]MBT4441477.1 hypothetical protein [archaeon]
MSDWKPNEPFLEWLLDEVFKKTMRIDIDTPFIYTPDGTKKGKEGYTLREVIDVMREGTPFGRSIYGDFWDEPVTRGEFEDYLRE